VGRLKLFAFLFHLAVVVPAFAAERPAPLAPKESELCRHLSGELEQARSFFSRGQYRLSAWKSTSLIRANCAEAMRGDAKRIGSLAFLELGERDEAGRLLQDLESTETGANLRKLRFVRAYALGLESDLLSESDRSRLRLWRLRDDGSAFDREFAAWKNSSGADRAAIRKLHADYVATRAKSPVLAGALSAVIPGAGQAYNGAWQSAGLAFVLNSIFLWATLDFADRDLKGAAVAAGTVFSVTYFGNILSAVDGANSLNRRARTPLEREMKQRLLPELSVQIPF